VKYLLYLTLGAALAWPQSTTNTYSTDINGRRVEAPSIAAAGTSANGERTERFQSINGRQVPLEQVVDRVVREDANGKVTERILKKFDPTGRLALTERVLIEENKLPGGGSSVRQSTYRTDVNGATHEDERRTTETRVQGSTTTANTIVDRPTLNGSFETVEKRSEVTDGPATNQHATESVFQRDGAGGFHETLRQVKTSAKQNETTTETTARYGPGVTGQLQLESQTESVSTKEPGGKETTQVNMYAHTVAGQIQDNNAKMRVLEQQIIERRTNSDGSVAETLSVRRPSVGDPNRLGELKKISETACKGKCEPEKTTAEPAKPAKP
jgi:hypothetical protein